jgi:hypothetical protein
VPRQLGWGSGEPFSRIALLRYFDNLKLQLRIGENADTEAIPILGDLAEGLPRNVDMWYPTFMTVEGATVRVAPDGSLEVVDCPS